MNNRFSIYVSRLFSSVLFKNKIVSTIILNLSDILEKFNNKINRTLNEDI